jgi:hypothetical protein
VLIRIVYCEMLGVPVPYAYVTALSATQEAKTSEKKVAYICASLCLRGVGEWSVLATNSLRRDLENSSILDQVRAAAALVASLVHSHTRSHSGPHSEHSAPLSRARLPQPW